MSSIIFFFQDTPPSSPANKVDPSVQYKVYRPPLAHRAAPPQHEVRKIPSRVAGTIRIPSAQTPSAQHDQTPSAHRAGPPQGMGPIQAPSVSYMIRIFPKRILTVYYITRIIELLNYRIIELSNY